MVGNFFPGLFVFVRVMFYEVKGAEDHGGYYDHFSVNDFSSRISGYDGWGFVEGKCLCDVVVC